MRIVEYRLRSGVTGHVFATAGTSSDDNVSATVQLHMGVSESGIPLSPATLVMPHYAQFVDQTLVSANLQLLGLGYSLATAPLDAGDWRSFRASSRRDVFRRAVDIARAGQRIFLGDDAPGSKRDALAHCRSTCSATRPSCASGTSCAARRSTARPAGAAVVRELEAAGLANGTTFETFVDSFGKALSHRDGYVAALVHGPESAGNARPYALSVRGATSGRRMDVPNEADERLGPRPSVRRALARSPRPGIDATASWRCVGRWTNEDLEVVVTPSRQRPVQLELLYPDTTDGSPMRAHFELTGAAGRPLRVPLSRGATSLNALTAERRLRRRRRRQRRSRPSRCASSARARTSISTRTATRSRSSSTVPCRRASHVPAVDLREKFHGEIDFNKDGVISMDEPRPISAAALQESGRVIDLTFDHALTPNASYTIEVDPLSIRV